MNVAISKKNISYHSNSHVQANKIWGKTVLDGQICRQRPRTSGLQRALSLPYYPTPISLKKPFNIPLGKTLLTLWRRVSTAAIRIDTRNCLSLVPGYDSNFI